jgi:outer membrane immunogenic protein
MKHLIFAAVAAATAATPALAQNGGVPFQGVHVEGLLGYETQQGPFPGEAGESNGLVYGVAGGFDIRRGNIVFGPEAELTGASTDTRGDGVVVPGDRLVVDSGRDLYAGGRLGYVVGERALLYGKLGYTNARFDIDYSGGANGAANRDGRNSGGLRAGAGVEVAAVGNTFVKGEYRYSDYGSTEIEHRHQFLLGAGFRF